MQKRIMIQNYNNYFVFGHAWMMFYNIISEAVSGVGRFLRGKTAGCGLIV